VHTFLERIVAARVRAVAEIDVSDTCPARSWPTGPPPDPVAAIRGAGGFVIAEIKRASPSCGVLATEVDVAERARTYAAGGAGVISVLTEPDFFRGSRGDLRAAVAASDVPVLAKDFVVATRQLDWALADGAGWVLLIAAVLNQRLDEFVGRALALGLEPLVEVHDEADFDRALETRARVIGINARDLATFEVDLARVERLAPRVPDDRACIAESGIHGEADVRRVRDAGAHGVLVGESLMLAADPAAAVRALRAAFASGMAK